MPRRARPAEVRRSEYWLRVAVNQATATLNRRVQAAFGWSTEETIKWRSPLVSDGYAEYSDESFLQQLGVTEPRVGLGEFWPAGGPRWDALARTSGGRLVLVEAKAHVGEIVDYGTRAGVASGAQIRAALASAKAAYCAAAGAPWDSPFYQYANRLAHLHYLRGLNGLEAYLVFLYFADAPEVPQACSVEQWRGAIWTLERSLGLPRHHRYRGSVASVILSVDELRC